MNREFVHRGESTMFNVAQGCRTLMLELYNISQKSRLDEHVLLPEQVSMLLKLDVEDTLSVVDYLEEAGYIKCGRPIGKPYSWVKLSVAGMKLIMDDSAFEKALQRLDPSASESSGHKTSPYSHNIDDVEHIVTTLFNLQGLSESANFPELHAEIKKSLSRVVECLRQEDDRPLKEFLSLLILKGGINTTMVGVKALLAVYGAEV